MVSLDFYVTIQEQTVRSEDRFAPLSPKMHNREVITLPYAQKCNKEVIAFLEPENAS